VYHTQGYAGAVLDDVAALALDPGLAGIDLDIQFDGGDLRLRHGFVAQKLLLIIRRPTLTVELGAIGIEDVGIVEDEGARSDKGRDASAR